jgi:hypothetical protein
LAGSVEALAFAAGAVVAFCAAVGACAEGAAGVAAVGLCGAAGACAEGAVVLEAALGGVFGVDGLVGACAQTGTEIASTAANATPLNRWFIVSASNPGNGDDPLLLTRSAISLVCHLTVERLIGCSLGGPDGYEVRADARRGLGQFGPTPGADWAASRPSNARKS